MEGLSFRFKGQSGLALKTYPTSPEITTKPPQGSVWGSTHSIARAILFPEGRNMAECTASQRTLSPEKKSSSSRG